MRQFSIRQADNVSFFETLSGVFNSWKKIPSVELFEEWQKDLSLGDAEKWTKKKPRMSCEFQRSLLKLLHQDPRRSNQQTDLV